MMLSCRASIKRFACSGVIIIRDFTCALATLGIIQIKSITNSEVEWAITARLAYVPPATSSFISIWS